MFQHISACMVKNSLAIAIYHNNYYEILDSCPYLVSYGYLHHLYTTCTHHQHFNGTIVEPVCVTHITMYICMYVCMYTARGVRH